MDIGRAGSKLAYTFCLMPHGRPTLHQILIAGINHPCRQKICRIIAILCIPLRAITREKNQIFYRKRSTFQFQLGRNSWTIFRRTANRVQSDSCSWPECDCRRRHNVTWRSRVFDNLGNPRPAANAYKTASEKLTGSTSVQKVNLGTNVYAYKFINSGKYIYAVWSTSPVTIQSPFSNGTTVTNIQGNSQRVNSTLISIDDSPVFIEQ